MPESIRLTEADIQIDRPLPWPVYQDSGVMLLQQGQSIASEATLQNLLARGLYRYPVVAEEPPPALIPDGSALIQLESFKAILRQSLERLAADEGALDCVLELAEFLDRLTAKNADVILGTLVLDEATPYATIHATLCAAIVMLLARRIELDDSTRTTLCCAALTANVGMLELQDELAQHDGTLDAGQKQAVEAHPGESAAILEQAGVTNTEWLSAVRQHHERLDGTGYPQGLSGDDISQGARMLAVADVYAAMILPRHYRTGLQTHAAVKEIFSVRGRNIDPELSGYLVKELGIYPPGTFVELANGDIGLVIRRGVNALDRPVVSCLANALMCPYQTPVIRYTEERDSHKVARPIPRPEAFPRLDLPLVWGFSRAF